MGPFEFADHIGMDVVFLMVEDRLLRFIKYRQCIVK
jgi:3-hydroxyacyl-CoA dehydrogenase